MSIAARVVKKISEHPIVVMMGLIGSLLSIATAVVTWFPNIVVEPFGAFDPSSTAPTQFNIKNGSIFALKDISPWLGTCVLGFENVSPRIEGKCDKASISGGLVPTFWRRESLAPGDSYTISLQDVVTPLPAAPIAEADIAIAVGYRVPLTWWMQERSFRFFTKKQSDGKLCWFRR